MLVLLFVTLECLQKWVTHGVGDKFAIGGDGTGGYMALALASLDKDSSTTGLSTLLIMLLQHMDNLFLTSFNLC